MLRKYAIIFLLFIFCAFNIFAGKLNQVFSGINAYEGKVSSIDRNGNIVTDISNREFLETGYLLGDSLSIYFDNGFYIENIPYIDGEYVQTGEAYILSSPSGRNVTLAIRGTKVASLGDLHVGDKFYIRMHEQKGSFNIQFMRSIASSNSRLDYESDEVFANFRSISAGHIASNKMYRASSPIDNSYGRALYSDSLSRRSGIKSVLNLADTLEDIKIRIATHRFRSNYYKQLYEKGNVVGLNMTSEFNTEKFATDITLGIACIIRHRMEPPILIHCTDGKNKTGYVCALLEALMGATYEEIVNDYMQSYSNYYSSKGKSGMSYNLVVDKNINDMLFSICRVKTVEELNRLDMSRAAREYLESHGMRGREIDELMSLLSSDV